MSSILDALEKASEKKGKGQNPDDGGNFTESPREKRLREENERHRRNVRLMMISGVVAFVLLIGTVGIFALVIMGRDGDTEAQESVNLAQATLPPTTEMTSQQPSPPSDANPVTLVEPSPTPEPTQTPMPSPTPWPSPTPPPSPTPLAAQQQRAQERPDYSKVFRDGQIIRPSEIGWTVDGVIEMGETNIAIINGRNVRAGQRFGGLHLIEVRSGLITVDVGNGVIVKVTF